MADPLGERTRGGGFLFFLHLAFRFFFTKVVRDRLTVDASVKRPASAPGLGVRARKLSDGVPDDVEGVLDVSPRGYPATTASSSLS